MERGNAPPEQPRRSNERQGGVPYNQLAEDMAGQLAGLEVPGTNNEAGTSDDGQIENENETESRPGRCELPRERDRTQRRTPYEQLAADMVQPSADLQVPGANGANEDETSNDVQTKNDMENRRDETSGEQRKTTARRRGRNPYFELAADIAGPLAAVRAPAISDERGSQHVQPQRQAFESFPLQESHSEYNPDASCGSGYEYESYGHSSLQSETRNERETETCQGEGTESVAEQESLSEYNENTSCGSGFYRSECDYSSVQTAEFGSTNQASFGTDGYISKSPTEIDTTHEKCYSQVDGEPSSKRTKPNPELTEEISLPRLGKSSTESTTVGDVDFASRQESIPEVCSVESRQNESFPAESEGEISTQDIEDHSRSRNVVSSFESCLTSEFEHMNLADNNSVETGASFDYSAEFSAPASQSSQKTDVCKSNQKLPEKDEDRSAVGKSTDSSVVGNDLASCSANIDDTNVSTASILSQGARPKTSANVPRGKKHKTPKRNTKNAYTELAKNVAGDLSVMNSQLDGSHATTRRAADEQKSEKGQELFDGSTVEITPAPPSLHAPPSELEQHDTPQQPSLINRRRDVRDQRANISGEIADTGASSRQTHSADTEAEHRSQVEEQQRLIDNMAPELQALVIEMMQRDEEEQRGHVLHGVHLNPPVPPRFLPQGHGGSANQGACAKESSVQSGGKKSRKGSKNKRHYVELAGIIAPELAAMNAAMVNGDAEEQQGATGHGRTAENHTRARGVVGESSNQERESNRGAGVSSRDQSRVHTSLPHSATNGRETTDGRGAFSLVDNVRTSSQRPGNGNRSHGGSADSTGKENRGKMGKQKKAKEEEKKKSSLVQVAESMAESLQSLNGRLEEQQRQQRSFNGQGATARPFSPRHETGMDSIPDEAVTRDTNSVVTHESNSSRKEHGYK